MNKDDLELKNHLLLFFSKEDIVDLYITGIKEEKKVEKMRMELLFKYNKILNEKNKLNDKLEKINKLINGDVNE